jgi:group II intron reverse transcriptase/maturase
LSDADPVPQGGNPWGFFCARASVAEWRRRKALWKLPELWKNQRTVFPQLLEPSVHSSHNAGCCWIIPKHNFSSTPPQGGVRTLGIPTVVDRLIQQALHQMMQSLFEPEFSKSSYGFRPGRNAHQAVDAARRYVAEGKRWVVDLDLEKFFDRVNHDVLMARVARRVKDKRVLKLIRRYLEAGLMEGGVASARTEGTPQGGPLSPLLSNILLTDLDRELEKRGHRFCRYAETTATSTSEVHGAGSG